MINNINDLREELIEAFHVVKKDAKRANQVKEQVNAAGKILGTVKAQMEYALARGEEPDITFMGKTSGRAITPAARRMLA